MLKYSHLSKNQKEIIKAMLKPYELRFSKSNLQYIMDDGQFNLKINSKSADGLLFNNYIKKCFEDNNTILFCVNVDFMTAENREAMEKENE